MLLADVAPKIRRFVHYQQVEKWQDVAFKASMALLQVGEVISLIDFAKNYSFKAQDEV
jgi:hypothetical protein